MKTPRDSALYDVVLYTACLIVGLHGILSTELSWWLKSLGHIVLVGGLVWAAERKAVGRIVYIETSRAAFAKSLWNAALLLLVVFPPYLLLAHYWNTTVFGLQLRDTLVWNISATTVLAQLIFVALPEELFFRGLIQTRLERIWPGRKQWWGISWGWYIPATALLFAVAHSLIAVQWWHFAIFFPGLLFGIARARSGGLLASIILHAVSNLVMQWMAGNYS